VEGPLGKGGFGRVYKVIDTFGDVTRALKIITIDLSSTAERMKQEYRTLANLPEHVGVVRVYDGDFLEGDRVPFLVMEFVEGASIADLITDKKLSVAEAHQMGIGVAEGLAHLHRHHVTHGDIKPANLMWTSRAVKIVDFNVAIRAVITSLVAAALDATSRPISTWKFRRLTPAVWTGTFTRWRNTLRSRDRGVSMAGGENTPEG